MSNASNLSTLANVLDDGSDGQFLKSTGSGGVAFDTVAAGATVYSSASDLPLTGNTVGDMAYVSAATTAKVVNQTTGSVSTEDATRLYIYSGTGWYSVAFITQNPTINTVQDAGNGSTPFTLATDGTTATVVTITANDPESVPLTYSYSVTSGSLNGCTVTGADGTSARIAGTAYTDNVFTVTPHASNDATFIITFTASDGINQATSDNAFSLSFVTSVTDSNYTTLLATATGTSDNNDITDSSIANSGNPHNITVNGDTYAGSFSPYRSGGYSWKFDGSNDNIQIADSTDFDFGSGDFTIEGFYKLNDASGNQYLISISGGTSSSNHFGVNVYSGNWRSGDFNGYMVSGVNTGIDTDSFHHFSLVRSSNNLKFYIDGTQIGSTVDVTNQTFDCAGNVRIGGFHSTGNFAFNGYLRDIRFVKGTAITPPSGGPTEPLEVVTNTVLLLCHAPYLKDGSSNDHSITINGSPTSKPFSPYDYDEYSATDHGGSVYFDGNGDYLTAASDASFDFGTGNFTIETWINIPDVTSTWLAIISRAYSATGGWRLYKSTGNSNLRFYYTGNSYINATNTGLTNNTWHHIAVVRSSGTITIYVDGASKGSGSDGSTSLNPGTYAVEIGSGVYQSSYPMTGYLSDLRIVNGTAVYSGAFTPPTGPLTTTGGTYASTTNVNTSITASNTSLLIKGTDASIIDKSQGFNLKLIGNTTGSTDLGANSDAYSGSGKYIKFDGSGDYINTNSNIQDAIGTAEYTAEAWIYCTGIANRSIFGSGSSDSADEFGLYLLSNGQIYHDIGGSFDYVQSSSTITVNTWHHLAVTRTSSRIDIWLDGTSVGSTTNSNITGINISGNSDFKIGYGRLGYWSGYIQDARLRIGKAEYTANFTPPTAPLEG